MPATRRPSRAAHSTGIQGIHGQGNRRQGLARDPPLVRVLIAARGRRLEQDWPGPATDRKVRQVLFMRKPRSRPGHFIFGLVRLRFLVESEMLAIARIDLGNIKQYWKIGSIEVWIPGGFAANGSPQGQISFDQRRHAGRKLAVEAFDRISVQRRYPMRTAARGHAFLGSSPYLGGRDSIVAQADAGAPENVLIPALLHERSE